MKLTAPAKINLNLYITGKREDGYHLLSTVMQTLRFFDEIEIEKNDSGNVTLICDTPGMPTDGKNLMCKAANLMKEKYGLNEGFDMKLTKRIPSQAGLGGGSSDAAAVMRAVNSLCSLNLSNEALRETAVKIGADVPFFIEGGTALCEGIGEKVTPIDLGKETITDFPVYTLIVKPKDGADTKEIYRLYDECSRSSFAAAIKKQDQDQSSEQCKNKTAKTDSDENSNQNSNQISNQVSNHNQNINGKCSICFGNVLEPITASLVKAVSDIKTLLYNEDAAYAAMSGSGTAVFGLFYDEKSMHAAAENIKALQKDAVIIETGFYGGNCI